MDSFPGSQPAEGPQSPEVLPAPPNQGDVLNQVTVFGITAWDYIPSSGWSKRKPTAVLRVLQGPRVNAGGRGECNVVDADSVPS